MKTQKRRSAPDQEVDHLFVSDTNINTHQEEMTGPLDAMIEERSVVDTPVTEGIGNRGMTGTSDPMIEGIEEMTIGMLVVATTRTNTAIMTDTAAATADTRVTIVSSQWVAIEEAIEIKLNIEGAAKIEAAE